MKTDMKAMRPDEFIRYAIEHKYEGELGAMEMVLTAMRDNTEFYHAIGLSSELAVAINGLYAARSAIKEIVLKLSIEEEE